GEALSRASRRDLGTIFREEIFQPLGMMHSSFGVDETKSPLPAVRYSAFRGTIPRDRPISRGGIAMGGSSVYASAHDLLLFGRFHMKSRLSGSRPVLTDALIDTMQLSTVAADGGMQYGIGWWVENDRFGYRSLL